MSESYIGEIRLFAGNFEIQNWAFCDGRLLQISQYTPLFALIGTTYGGNGTTNFALPNLKGRTPVHAGQSAQGSYWNLGQPTGAETGVLAPGNLPSHTHPLVVSNQPANSDSPANALVAPAVAADSGLPVAAYATAAGATLTTLAPGSISPAGQGGQISLRQPSLALNFIICLNGNFPARP